MDDIDLSGWRGPKGEDVTDCVSIVRGMPQMIDRLVVEVPQDKDSHPLEESGCRR
jgi:hypothetical protein